MQASVHSQTQNTDSWRWNPGLYFLTRIRSRRKNCVSILRFQNSWSNSHISLFTEWSRWMLSYSKTASRFLKLECFEMEPIFKMLIVTTFPNVRNGIIRTGNDVLVICSCSQSRSLSTVKKVVSHLSVFSLNQYCQQMSSLFLYSLKLVPNRVKVYFYELFIFH
jgi:hypothetical protein